MRHCPNCRNLLHDHATYCPKCHMTFHKTSVRDDISFGLGILGFLIPILGLILYVVWQDKYPKRAKSCAIGALIACLLWELLSHGIYIEGIAPMISYIWRLFI